MLFQTVYISLLSTTVTGNDQPECAKAVVEKNRVQPLVQVEKTVEEEIHFADILEDDHENVVAE
jgi:hypothetical protein